MSWEMKMHHGTASQTDPYKQVPVPRNRVVHNSSQGRYGFGSNPSVQLSAHEQECCVQGMVGPHWP
uniref:Uncharacterized protein n=1 Tax=Anguilla anguilla TaxID=7936 RepID=A0A0E9W4H9_ANGAN